MTPPLGEPWVAQSGPVIPDFGKGSNCVVENRLFCPDWVRDNWSGTLQPALVEHVLTEEDVKGPFVEDIPERLEDKAKLKQLGFTGPAEALAEAFHMDEDLLTALNPGKDLKAVGTPILVAAVASKEKGSAKVARIDYKLNINTLHRDEAAQSLSLNEIGRVQLRIQTPLLFDAYRRNRTTGSFILVDEATNNTVAGGMILGPTAQDSNVV